MEANIFIIHGAYGHPEENWFPWLKNELEKRGRKVFVPKFPTPEGNTLENWLKVFKKHEEFLNEDSIVIGHSLGVPFLLTILENKSVASAYFVAGYNPETLPKTNEWYELVKTFVAKPFNWKKIKENCKNFQIYHSDNDPYFPLELAEDLAKPLNTKVNIIRGAGHFNEKAGYTKFEKLLEEIAIPSILLRPIRHSDIDICWKWINDPEVTRHMAGPFPETFEEEQKWFEENLNKKTEKLLAIIDKKTNAHIGNIGIHNLDKDPSLGIIIGEKSYWDKGYGTTAIREALKYCFQELKLSKISLTVSPENKRAIRCYEKVGFKKAGGETMEILEKNFMPHTLCPKTQKNS
ncbi:MAG: GNAT family N-acetyltransferase [Patescibacteria group bacterium]|nr:GNAT family N-acetyltransferase [Patescibacteria group bacterium]